MERNRVWVTGANGHLGYNLTKTLVERGYRVRASVRDLRDAGKTRPLESLGVELVEASLEDPRGLARAAAGMDGVFHVAAAFDTAAADPATMLDRPNIDGTRHLLEAAADANVRKVVLTSSIAAVGTTRRGEAALDESSWNERAIEPYARSKREAERVAWSIAKSRGLRLVTILPGTMLGPGLHRHTPSTKIVATARAGKLPIVPPLAFSYVDVRDVAFAHVLAYESERAEGRYIASDRTLTIRELLVALRAADPAIRVPAVTLPEALLFLLPIVDALEHALLGNDRQITRDLIAEYGRRVQSVSSDRLRRELGWTTRPLEETLVATLAWLDQHPELDGGRAEPKRLAKSAAAG